MLKVIIVDDHALYREGVRSAISKLSCSHAEVIGEAGSGTEFFMLLDEGYIPDLVILDIMLPDMSGVEIAKTLKNENPDLKVIMLSSNVSEELITELLEIGVDGYLNKYAKIENIRTAICTILGGNQYFGRSVAKMMYDIYLGKQYAHSVSSRKTNSQHQNYPKSQAADVFTEREKEIISLLCDGKPTKDIAEKLHISTRTVESHKSNILNKLGFTNIIELVKYAIKEGIVEL